MATPASSIGTAFDIHSDSQPEARDIAVLAPWPLFTVTIECHDGENETVYLHAGGQGVWVARMVASLGQRPMLVGPFGGESRHAIRDLVEAEGIGVRAISVKGRNGGYVDDRRSGSRQRVATGAAPRLDRHEMDDLYNAAFAEGLRCGTLVMTGVPKGEVLPVDFFKRLALDLSANGVAVVADISGSLLQGVEEGLAVLKVSHEELIDAGLCESDGRDAVVAAMEKLTPKARNVVVSLADKGVLALFDGIIHFAAPPRLQVVDPSGAGDSMTAALAVASATGMSGEDALRLATAAGAMNVTRHGRGSGNMRDILELARRIDVEVPS